MATTLEQEIKKLVSQLSGESFDLAINEPNKYAVKLLELEKQYEVALLSLFEKYGKEVVGELEAEVDWFDRSQVYGLPISARHYGLGSQEGRNELITEQTKRLKQILGGNDAK